ncbi:adenylyl-sulfate kinase [Microbacterium sp. NPDC058345]|uniref:adenylyl-sulfate kinase n=1 Tax=Microbacterium sp. NPDC058345 TaxID=3346455 RepID=UPI0036606627
MTSASRSIVLSGPRLDGLEVILTGLLHPVDGYRLPGDVPEGWPLAPNLEVADPLTPGERLLLEDPDRTPLAVLDVQHVRESESGRRWVGGTLRSLRRPEHGLARELRATLDTDLHGRRVALFAGSIRPADVLSAAHLTGSGPVDFVFVGASNAPTTARGIRDLTDSAAQLRDARVIFVPEADLGAEEDVAAVIVRRLGGTDVHDFRRPAEQGAGAVVLFTGLSGAGKSTLARALVEHLHAHSAQPTVLLDGDDVRREIAGELGFGREDRDRNLQRIAWVAARIAEVGGLAVCAPIAPFASSRDAMRAKVEPASPFVIVYVATPLAVAESRDRKGLYARARAGLIPDFTGIDSPYEEPADADLVLDTSVSSVDDGVAQVVRMLAERGVLAHAGITVEEPKQGAGGQR